MSLMALICSWRLLNLNRNQCISLSSIDTGWTPGDLLGVEDLSEDENQHDVLVVFPQTVQLRLAQLVELRHSLGQNISESKNISNIFSNIIRGYKYLNIIKILDLDKF